MTEANTDRISGAATMRQRLGDAEKGIPATWKIWKSCPRLIACLPRMVADPKRLEDVLKVNADRNGNGGDDEYDDARYGLQEGRVSMPVPPPVKKRNVFGEQPTGNRWKGMG